MWHEASRSLSAGMHFDTFSLYFPTLRADISAPVSPGGLKSTLFESEGSSDSLVIDFNPEGLKVKIWKGKQKVSKCMPASQ